MLGMNIRHTSGVAGSIDAEAVSPDGSAVVRIADRWFPVSECGPRKDVLPRWIKI